MSKKKRQSDPDANDADLTDSPDENQNTVECPHIGKAVDLQRIRKALLKTGFLNDCDECKKNPGADDLEMNGDIEFDLSLWLCLKCGNQACGRARNQHALQHYNTPHSDSHAMCVNTTVWSVWCYDCDEEINITCRQKLLETIKNLKKMAEKNRSANAESSPPSVINNKDIELILSPTNSLTTVNNSTNLPRVRGLSNLGNTCFFNSVMQCLGQTPYLVHLLEETSRSGETFRLPGGKLSLGDKTTIYLEPLEGTLEEWRPLTKILAETLAELQSGRSEVYVPRILLSRLTTRMPQFGGGDQHDAHELLRHLLEAVREEDLRRYQAVILEKFGFSRKTDPASVEGEKKKIIRFYGQQASEFLLPTEQVFRGVLLSTLQCEDCEHTSCREEFFLDLSLPISETLVPPVQRRKAEELDDNKPSQYQIKKEKRAAKKNKKQKNNRNANIQNISAFPQHNNSGNNSENESDADVEDNVEVWKSNNEDKKAKESGYNSDIAEDGSPDNDNMADSCMIVDDSGVPSPSVGMLSASANESPDNSLTSSETNIDMESPGCGRNSPVLDCSDVFERPESRLSFAKNKDADLKADFLKLSLMYDENGKKTSATNMEGCEEDQDEKMEEASSDSDNVWGDTMSARYICESGEYSVQSCLNQFTACELMTGSNKVGCELCTKRQSGSEKKTVYTNARKQLLIYNPPAVLILHLKRFQVHRFCSTKVQKHVAFPTLLDLAPFCSKKSQKLPTFEIGQNKVLYSLYGVVEHSGSMLGGHYVAYVKVRPQLADDDCRWNFLPKNQSKIVKKMDSGGARAEPEEPQGKWYYVSDSHVAEVPESKVLRAQAYLLFYERIL